LIIRNARYTQAGDVVCCETLLVEEMSYPLAELDARCAVTVLHRYAPENVCEVELDLKVSMVRNWKAAENSGVAGTVYTACTTALL